MFPTLLPPSVAPARGPIWLPGRLRRAAPDFGRIAAVLAYWEALRAGRAAPARSEIDPAAIGEHLEVLFVAEIVAPGIARFRLAGQHLVALAGMEPRGMPLSCLFEAPARADLAQAVAQVGMGARVILSLRADRGIGQPVMDGRLALLPLTDGEGRITRILGALETCGQPGRAPRRFRLSGPADAATPHATQATPEVLAAPATPEARRAAFRVIPGRG